MCLALADESLLEGAVFLGVIGLLGLHRVEERAPASAPHAVVPFGEVGVGVPRLRSQRSNGEGRGGVLRHRPQLKGDRAVPSSGCIAERWRSRVGWPTGAAWPSDGVTRTQYYTATSLDGYIADEHNCLDWLFEVDRGEGDDDSFRRFFADVGAVMGATTFEWVLDHDRLLDRPEKWRVYYGETPCWVFTHRTLPPVPGADIRFVQEGEFDRFTRR